MSAALGHAFKLYMRPETSVGTAATGNYDQVPVFPGFNLAPAQSLTQDDILSSGANRDGADPYYGVVSVEGSARVPLDTVHIGRWLRLLLGAPSTSGAGPNYVHTYQSGSAALPANTIEKAYTDRTLYEQIVGVRAGTMAIAMNPDGSADAEFGLMGLAEVASGSSGAGTPVITAYQRFFSVNGSVRRGGSLLAAVTNFTVNFTNDFEAFQAIRDDYRVEGIEAGLAKASGTVTLRFASHALYNAATAATAAASLEARYTINADTELSFQMDRTFLAKTGKAIESTRGISQTFNWIAGPDATKGIMRVVLKNQTASYA